MDHIHITHSSVVLDEKDKFWRSNSAIRSMKPAAKNLTTSLRTRGPLMGDGVHASAIDMLFFGTDYKDLVMMIQNTGAWPKF